MLKILKNLLFGQHRVEKRRQTRLQLNRSLEHNLRLFKEIFHQDDTIYYRHIETSDNVACLLIFMEGMVEKESLQENIIAPLQQVSLSGESHLKDIPDFLTKKLLLAKK